MKVRYAYSSADGMLEKMQGVESVMTGIQARMDKLNARLKAVEQIRLQNQVERKSRTRWLLTGAIGAVISIVWMYFR
jgi:hypothetical protein